MKAKLKKFQTEILIDKYSLNIWEGWALLALRGLVLSTCFYTLGQMVGIFSKV